MNKWQARVAIVKAFVDGGHPGYALAAIIVPVTPLTIGAITALVRVIW